MGRVSGIYALSIASKLLQAYSDISYCLLVGVDSLLIGSTLSVMEENNYLLTS